MIKVKILNIRNFLNTVNQCTGKVLMLSPEGEKTDINKNYTAQYHLEDQYLKNGRRLPLTLEFEKPSDYMSIMAYYAGDC